MNRSLHEPTVLKENSISFMATGEDKDLAESLGLLWSDSEFGLSEFLDIFPLPQLVQVSEGVYGESDESTLPAGQTLTLHVVKETKMFRGYTYNGDDVLVPLNCPQKVEVRPQSVSLEYDTVEQLYGIFVAGRVKYVRVTKDHSSHFPERCLKAGQKLKIEYLTRDKSLGKKPTLVCLDEQGCEVCLAMDVQGGFQPLADNSEYFLAELTDHFPLPVYVQFTSPPKFNVVDTLKIKKCERFLNGLIQMDEIVVEHTVIASTRAGGRKTILTFPRSLDVDLVVPEQLLSKDPTYARVCETLNDGMDLVRAGSLSVPDDEVIYGNRAQLVRELSCSTLLEFPSHDCESEHYDDTLPMPVRSEKSYSDDDAAYIEIDKQYIDDGVYEEVDDLWPEPPKPTSHSLPSRSATLPNAPSSSRTNSSSDNTSSVKSLLRKFTGKMEDKESAG